MTHQSAQQEIIDLFKPYGWEPTSQEEGKVAFTNNEDRVATVDYAIITDDTPPKTEKTEFGEITIRPEDPNYRGVVVHVGFQTSSGSSTESMEYRLNDPYSRKNLDEMLTSTQQYQS